MRISKSRLMNGIRFVLHHFFRTGFFSMIMGVAIAFYGITLLLRNRGWISYFEIVIGCGIVALGHITYRNFLSLQKRLEELKQFQEAEEKLLEAQEKRINWF